MPAAIKSLQAHLGDGDPAAWRAALRVFEQAFGRPVEVVEEDDPRDLDVMRVSEWTASERAVLRARLLELHPELVQLVPARLRDGYEPEEFPVELS